jgi:ABC-2 type transport system permease protein
MTLYRAMLKLLTTRGRVLAMGSLGFVAVLLAIVVRGSSAIDRQDAAFRLVNAYGLSVLIPVVSLVFASAALGDPAEDGTLVYLWLRPLPRWRLAVTAALAALTVSVPIAVLPVILAAAISGAGARLVAGAAVGACLSSVGYTAVFCGLGLRVRRALGWGLAYVLIWEGAVARLAKAAARLSISVTSATVTARIAHHSPLPRNAMSMPVAIAFPVIAVVLALTVTTRSLDKGEIA